MLYGNESISHYTPSNIVVWMTMSFQAGLLNIGGFMACHQFISHVTGYAGLFGYEISRVQYNQAMGMLVVPLFFLFGSMVSGQLVDQRLLANKKPKYYLVFTTMFFIIFLVFCGGVLDYFGPFGDILKSHPKEYVLLALLCLVCGIQNGTVTTVSKSVIRTTHLTGITTDLGIGLVRVLKQNNGLRGLSSEAKANFMRIGIIVFFGMGSVAGGYLFAHLHYWGFILPLLTSGILAGVMFYFQVYKSVKTKALKLDI